MAKRKRLRRPDPERTGPIRHFSTMFHRDGDASHTRAGSADEISDAVQMGYSVIEDQIRQGQRAARQLWGAGLGSGSGTGIGTLTDVANRLLRFSTDLAALHFDLMTALLHSSEMRGFTSGVAPAQSGGSRVVVEIESKRKNRVTVDLWPGKHSSNLRIPALYSGDTDKEPITGISFAAASDQSPARMTIVIPDNQPPGVYSGLILDTKTSQACGTVSVTLES